MPGERVARDGSDARGRCGVAAESFVSRMCPEREPRDARLSSMSHNVRMASRPGTRKRVYNVYVIELDRVVMAIGKFRKANPDARPDRMCVYIGATARPNLRQSPTVTVSPTSTKIIKPHVYVGIPSNYKL